MRGAQRLPKRGCYGDQGSEWISTRPRADSGTDPAGASRGKSRLVQAVRTLNTAAAFGDQNEITFQVDRTSRLPVIRIVDRNTKELVTQIPAEYVLRMAEDLAHSG